MLAVLDGLSAPWWIAGGYAIDAFAGSGRREHDDVDVSVFASDQLAVRAHLSAWELHFAENPPGMLHLWTEHVALAPHIHDIWARGNAADAWRFQLMLNPGGPDELVFRRDETVRMPLAEATWVKDGVRYLTPEWQLLFKSRGLREKDQRDFEDCLPLLSAAQREWLRTNLIPDHAWASLL